MYHKILILLLSFFVISCNRVIDGNKIDPNLVREKLKINISKEGNVLNDFGSPTFKIEEDGLDCWYYVSSLSKRFLSIRFDQKYYFLKVCFDKAKILKELNSNIDQN